MANKGEENFEEEDLGENSAVTLPKKNLEVEESKNTQEDKALEQIEIPEIQDPVNINQVAQSSLFQKELQKNINLTPEMLLLKKKKVLADCEDWHPYFDEEQDVRIPDASPKGGNQLLDETIIKIIRSSATELIKQIGRKILSGSLNLTKISFPIKCMAPATSLHYCCKTLITAPLYLNKAAQMNDPLERVKLFITYLISSFHLTSNFLKPINPILGETCYAIMEDGTEVYTEQTSHHPPNSHFQAFGPDGQWEFTGYFGFTVKSSLNSVSVLNYGKRQVKFADGQLITCNFPKEEFSSILWGTLRHESLGKMTFDDQANEIHAEINIGNIKGKPSDYLEGKILCKNESPCIINGTYLGWLDFDGVRYFDYRFCPRFDLMFKSNLPSDSGIRKDLILFKQGQVEPAQKAKEELEELQRHDRKVREQYEKKQAKNK